MSYSPASRLAVIFWVKPGAIFSRSSTTITPFRISHSTFFWLVLCTTNWVLPAGTVSCIGSHCLSLTVIFTCGTSAARASMLSANAGRASNAACKALRRNNGVDIQDSLLN
ncbi:hypothetical protein D3C87_1867790 [compost metagenome]